MQRVFSFSASVEGFNQTVEAKLLKASEQEHLWEFVARG
jgi:hypothetical protein